MPRYSYSFAPSTMTDMNTALQSVISTDIPLVPDFKAGPPFTILERHLLTSSSSEDGAQELVRPLIDGTCLQAPFESKLRVDCYVYLIFADIMYIAAQIPWNHPWHQRLGSLIKAPGKQPAPPRKFVPSTVNIPTTTSSGKTSQLYGCNTPRPLITGTDMTRSFESKVQAGNRRRV